MCACPWGAQGAALMSIAHFGQTHQIHMIYIHYTLNYILFFSLHAFHHKNKNMNPCPHSWSPANAGLYLGVRGSNNIRR